MPKVSIIVPIYNVENYLEQCIRSLISQSMQDIEIILIDDGSTDKSGEIVDLYAQRDERIIAIHKSNGGQSSARNIGLEKATGKYVLFVDSDDYIITETCDRFYDVAEKLNADIVEGDTLNDKKILLEDTNYRSMPREGEVLNSESFLRKKIVSETYDIVPWLYFVKLDYLKIHNISFPEGHFYEDQMFTLELLTQQDSKITKIRFPFYYYRSDRPDSTTNYITLKKGSDVAWICNHMRLYIDQVSEHYSQELLSTVLMISYFQFIRVWLRLRVNDRKVVWDMLEKKDLKNVFSRVNYYRHIKKEVVLFLKCRNIVLFKYKFKQAIKAIRRI